MTFEIFSNIIFLVLLIGYLHYFILIMCYFVEGYYMYIETSIQTKNDTANLESPLVNFATSGNTQGTVCVRFWYHMYGAHVDALNVFIKTGSSLPSNPVWTKKGTQGDKWRLAQIVVSRTPAFKVSSSSVELVSFNTFCVFCLVMCFNVVDYLT